MEDVKRRTFHDASWETLPRVHHTQEEKKQTEQLVVHVKDMLEQKGIKVCNAQPHLCVSLFPIVKAVRFATGFFYCDNLETINQDELNKSIRESCMLVVFLDDLTFKSQWVRNGCWWGCETQKH
jgi:hypothetical protein